MIDFMEDYYKGINALSPRQQSTMVSANGGYCADPSLEGGYYWVADYLWSNNGSCGYSVGTTPSCPSGLVTGGGKYSCQSSQQNSYCRSTGDGRCRKCKYRTTEQILHNTPPSP